MDRLTFDGNFCDISLCRETRYGSFCEDGACSQRKVWERLKEYEEAEEQGLLVRLPCKQYEAVWYIFDSRTYVGWYLAKVNKTTHLILTDKIELGTCWVTDGFWFLTREEAEAALKGAENHE